VSSVCRRFLVSGKVQGVWFRESTKREAIKLNLEGYAINLPDGRVEVVAAGDESGITALALWLQQGPRLARVDSVIEEETEESGWSGFTTA
jgi:acylphosphatase